MKTCFYVIFVMLFFLSKGLHAEPVLIDRIVAIVNSDSLLHSDVINKIKRGNIVAISEFPADEKASDYEKAMQDAVNLELIKQKAEELEISITDADFEQEVSKFIKSRNMSREALVEALKQQGMSFEEYREDFKDQMLLRKFQGMVIAPMVKITDRDVESFYIKKSGSNGENRKLVLHQILISVPSGSSAAIEEAKRTLAREVFQKLGTGLSFKDAVQLYSDDELTKSREGLMPEVSLKDLSPQILSAVENLEPGQFSSPVRTGLGFHIFLLEKFKFTGSEDFQRQKQSVENELRAYEFGVQTKRWIADQRKRVKVNIIP